MLNVELFTNEHCAAAGKHSNCSAAVELVASGRAGGGDGDGGADDTDATKTTEYPSELDDESRAIREPDWSDTWPTCWGGARRRRLRLRRGADPLETETGGPPGGDEGDADDESDDPERHPSSRMKSVPDLVYSRRHGNRPTMAMVAFPMSCCTNCHRRWPTMCRSLRCCCC